MSEHATRIDEGFQTILDLLPVYEQQIQDLNEIVLANLVLISEIPAPTFEENRRMEFLLERFSEYQLQNTSTDEVGNALGILPGTEGNRNILVSAHIDTPFSAKIDHTLTIQPAYVSGPSVGDNSLGVATVATIPLILEQLGIQLKSNLVLMGSARSLGKGNIEGIRFFLNNNELTINAGISVEGVRLGRLSYSSLGVIRGEINCRVPEEYDWSRFGASGAIVNINDVINRIVEIPIPRRPRTTIVFNSVQAGSSSNDTPTQGTLQFEVRSESAETVRRVGNQITDIAAEVSSQSGAEVWVNVFARRDPGGIGFGHPLAARAREIMKALNVDPRISPSTTELSAFIDRGIPAVTVGITDGEFTGEENERIEILPIAKGIAQLVGLIVAIDQGYCDDEPGQLA
ncbi:MAG TPA: peptidase dimerization domain-containing protein [Spirochaetia bacterium]|nr:peptidase dimerization domain-containing protein [Spirochaetia bacterium]